MNYSKKLIYRIQIITLKYTNMIRRMQQSREYSMDNKYPGHMSNLYIQLYQHSQNNAQKKPILTRSINYCVIKILLCYCY